MLQSLFDQNEQFNAAHWVLLSGWSGWVYVILAVLIMVLVVLSWRNLQSLSPSRRRVLFGLRAITLVLVSLLFIQPGVRLEDRNVIQNHVVVLVDQSLSMSLPGVGEDSRLEDAKRFLKANQDLFDTWSKDHQVHVFGFDDQVRPVSAGDTIEAVGERTNYLTVLEDIAARYPADDLAAVILVSDGADNADLKNVRRKGHLSKSARSVLERLNAPIHTVYTGPDVAPKDLAISDVLFDEFAFVRNAVTIEGSVDVQGYSSLTVPVRLFCNGKELGQKRLEITPGTNRYQFSFEFVPEETGKAVFNFRVDPAPGEDIIVNNHRDFVIRVIRDKIRVLQVVGRPSWDERFLRKLLKKNPNVDLISFFILRTSTSISPSRRDEMSLIPFPTDELFHDQLGSFDLIIFQNFTYRGYRMRQYLPLIKRYVQNGGGFVMLGGDISFTHGGYSGTAIEDFLPVSLLKSPQAALAPGTFRPQLTEVGRFHPITSLSIATDENEKLWGQLPQLDSLNRVASLRPDAHALMVHPTETLSGSAAPVMAIREYGEGRVLTLMTDSTWKWDFLSFGDSGDNQNYYKFWGNAIRWLIRDPALKPIRVTTDRDRYAAQSTVTARVRLVDDQYRPSVDAPVQLVATVDRANANDDVPPIKLEGRTNEVGELIVRFTPSTDGPWTLTAQAQEREALSDQDIFIVSSDPLELTSTAPQPKVLSALSNAGGGEALMFSESMKDIARKPPEMVQVNRRKDIPVWSNGWVLALMIIMPTLEWFLRRRWGLL